MYPYPEKIVYRSSWSDDFPVRSRRASFSTATAAHNSYLESGVTVPQTAARPVFVASKGRDDRPDTASRLRDLCNHFSAEHRVDDGRFLPLSCTHSSLEPRRGDGPQPIRSRAFLSNVHFRIPHERPCRCRAADDTVCR